MCKRKFQIQKAIIDFVLIQNDKIFNDFAVFASKITAIPKT